MRNAQSAFKRESVHSSSSKARGWEGSVKGGGEENQVGGEVWGMGSAEERGRSQEPRRPGVRKDAVIGES